MMAPNSKSFHKLLALALFIVGCDRVDKQPTPAHKCQAVVVVDKTNSVNYIDKLTKLQKVFSRNVEQTYANSEKNIQLSRLTITGNTSVIPEYDYFEKNCPEGEEKNRTTEASRLRWKIEKRRWLSDEVQQVVALIDSPCHSNTTEIFSIFSGIQDIQRLKSPWDSINVFIFSDMTNTSSRINMVRELNIGNAKDKGKEVCQKLMACGQISADTIGNLYLTIYTPSNMTNTGLVRQFWKGFFEQWGLADDHYHFE